MTGWSLKRIEYEAEKRKWGGFEDADRYHPARDLARQQDWEWAVDLLARRMDISPGQRSAAHRYYEAQQTMLGDVAPDPRGMALDTTEDRYTRAERIARGGLNYVLNHPDLTLMRRWTFDRLFAPSQPTLETLRQRGGKRMNQREAIDRVRWCCEVLANHFDGQGYEEAAVNEKHMGVGEGWSRVGDPGTYEPSYVESLQAQGMQVFMAPSGAVYARNPAELSCFEPLDASPQIAALKT